jgi:TolA-binding protein
MDSYPDSRFVENCRYWIAQCRFAAKDYSAAAAGFQSVIDDTRYSHKDDDASLMLGLSYFQTGKLQEAIAQLHLFLETFDKSEYRGKVEQWIERMSLIKSRG